MNRELVPKGRAFASAGVLAFIVLVLHLAMNPHYGFFRDELYFIMCGTRPAWGYVDQPPLTPLLAAASQIFGHSLFMLRAVAALFAGASAYVTCQLAKELGGGAFAQRFAVLVAFLCPVLMSFGMKVSTDMVGLALWPAAALFTLRAVERKGTRDFIFAGAALGVSFEAKYSVVMFAAALVIGLLATAARRALWSRGAALGALVAIAIALPNAAWQWAHGFPMLELLRNGQRGKNVILSPAQFVVAELLITNPLFSLVWLTGLVWLARAPRVRFLAVMFVALIAIMIAMHAKHYYPANVYPIMFAAGAVAIESLTARAQRAGRVLLGRASIAGLAIAAGLVLVPYVEPVLPVPLFIAYNRAVAPVLHLKSTKTENHADGPLPQDWADMQGWPEMASAVAGVVATLTPEERARAVVVAGNYGEAAALEFFGKDLGMPPVVSGHNQYFLWGTRGRDGDVLIDVDGDCGKDENLFRSSMLAATFTHPLVMPYENDLPIMICRGINRPIADVWPKVKTYR